MKKSYSSFSLKNNNLQKTKKHEKKKTKKKSSRSNFNLMYILILNQKNEMKTT